MNLAGANWNEMMNHEGTRTFPQTAPVEREIAALVESRPFHAPVPQIDPLTRSVRRSAEALLSRQYSGGYWRFDLEADTTIPAEYMLLQHFMERVNPEREARLADYIRRRHLPDGSWPLYEGGPGNLSATVKAYFALKLAGESPASPLMQRAKKWVLTHGGAEKSNVFTRITLALFGQVSWHTVPAMPAEIIWLPRWFIFNLDKVSYWSRCVIVPLLILFALRPVRRPAPEYCIDELFTTPPARIRHIDQFASGEPIKNTFIAVDRLIKKVEPLMPRPIRRAALRRCEEWMRDHMSGDGGIGGIYPAMANAVMALRELGCDESDPDFVRGIQAIEDLVLDEGEESYVQPCVSPIWDTCLTINALTESGVADGDPAIQAAVDWLFDKQVFVRGDWSKNSPHLDGGGWAFQFENDFYPDVDDTSMVVMSLLRAHAYRHPDKRRRIGQAVNWVLGMQNSDGGWGAFDIDNNNEYLNNIPFADHGALVDPSTADLTGRCIEMLAMLGYDRSFPPIARALDFLRLDQKDFGGWYGRWGVNYIYGTWAVLVGLGALGEDPNQPYIRRAIEWLKSIQNPDGGWGEGCNSYDDPGLHGKGDSTPSQTAWALLGLMAVGEIDSEPVERGIHYLLRNAEGAGGWKEAAYTGTGFPRVFYLRYHGYSHYFPTWALGVYHSLKHGIPTRQERILKEGLIDVGVLPVLKGRRCH
jgi:squalene-hopene/tetraprenyl-beta-curcumene cyclase